MRLVSIEFVALKHDKIVREKMTRTLDQVFQCVIDILKMQAVHGIFSCMHLWIQLMPHSN